MNHCLFSGNLAADPEARTTSNGLSVTNFRLAVSERVKGEPQTMWIRVSCFGKQAETAINYLHKGSKILAAGKIRLNTFTGKDGMEKTSLELDCSAFDFLDSKHDSNRQSAPAPVRSNGSEQVDEMPW